MIKPTSNSPTPATVPTETKKEEIKSDPNKSGSVAQETSAAVNQGAVSLGISTAGMGRTMGAVMAANLSKAAGIRTPSAAELKQIENCINNGDKQKAIELTVKYYNIDISSVKGMPKYNKDVSGEGVTRRYTKEVEMGDDAFKFNGKASPQWLASSILHESVHAKQLTDPERLKNFDASAQTRHAVEVEAYDREISESTKTGLTPDMVKELKERRKSEYDELNAINQKKHDIGDNAGIK